MTCQSKPDGCQGGICWRSQREVFQVATLQDMFQLQHGRSQGPHFPYPENWLGFDLGHFDRYLCQWGLVGPGVDGEGEAGWDPHLAGSGLKVRIKLQIETGGQNILLQSTYLNFHVLVAHGNKQAGGLWINSRGDQLGKLCGAHSHQHPHLHCRKVASTDNHLVSQRRHDGAEHIFTSIYSAPPVSGTGPTGPIWRQACSTAQSAEGSTNSNVPSPQPSSASSAGYQYHFLQQQSSSFLFKSCRLLKHFQRMVRKMQ